ncbi:hypothetical protein V1264_006475 [Littorina saxatilis]|uniref:Fibrinogen C-terminal domain-containing protein n=1 Tax=Littorina saxatilis TaxID=31220 RepID=A0AAN9AXT2_9CAEN
MEIQTELLILLLTGFPLSHTIAQTTDTTSLSSTIEDVGVYHVCQAPALGIQSSPNVLRSRSALECGRQCSQSAQCRGVTVCPDRGVDGGVLCEIKEVMPNVLCSHDNQPDEGCYFMKKDDGYIAPSSPTGQPAQSVTTEMPCQNGGTADGDRCLCPLPYAGETCNRYMRDCTEGFDNGHQTGSSDGEYLIQPLTSPAPFVVMCEFGYGHGNTQPLIRLYQNSPPWSNKTWSDYKNGLGISNQQIPDRECYFIGLDKLHQLLDQANYSINVFAMYDHGGQKTASFYMDFNIGNESSNYELRYNRFFTKEDPGGNGFHYSPSESTSFSSYDHQPTNCASASANEKGAGWYGPHPGCYSYSVFEDPPYWPLADDTAQQMEKILFNVHRDSDFYED